MISATKRPGNHEWQPPHAMNAGRNPRQRVASPVVQRPGEGRKPVLPMNEGRALPKLRRVGWALVKNRGCPECETKRKIAENQ